MKVSRKFACNGRPFFTKSPVNAAKNLSEKQGERENYKTWKRYTTCSLSELGGFRIRAQARSVVIFSSTHKYIWSRNLSKLSEKYCVLYLLFEIVVWIQAKNKASCLILRKLGANTALFWSWILEHALSRVFRFIEQLSFISKERGVFLCAVQTGRAHSQHWFIFPCGCAILLTMKGDGRSSCFVVVSSTLSPN